MACAVYIAGEKREHKHRKPAGILSRSWMMDVLESLAYVDFVVSARVRFVQSNKRVYTRQDPSTSTKADQLSRRTLAVLISTNITKDHIWTIKWKGAVWETPQRDDTMFREKRDYSRPTVRIPHKQPDDTTRDWEAQQGMSNQDQQPASQNQRSSPWTYTSSRCVYWSQLPPQEIESSSFSGKSNRQSAISRRPRLGSGQ